MRSTIVDSGPLIALFNRSDKDHERAVHFVKTSKIRLVTNLAVVTEVSYMLDFAVSAQIKFLKWITQAAQIDRNTPEDIRRITEIMDKYDDLPADFADASLVALSERIGTLSIATNDRDFLVYRNRSKQAFENPFNPTDV